MKKIISYSILILLSNCFAFSQSLDTIYFKDSPQPILATGIRFDSELLYYQQKENLGTEVIVKKSSVVKICYWDKSVKYFNEDFMPVVIDTLTNYDRRLLYNAGIQFKRYTEFTYIGLGTALAGSVMVGVGFGIENTTVGYIGLGIAGAGLILGLIPPIHIAKAGNFLIQFGIKR